MIPSPTPSWQTTWETIVAEHVVTLRELSDIASDYGIKLAFEFLGFGWCSVRTPRGAQEIIQKTGRDNVGMTVDAAVESLQKNQPVKITYWQPLRRPEYS